MFFHGFFKELDPWGPHGVPWDPWEPMGTHGDPWGLMETHGNPWKPMGTHGNPWEPWDLIGPPLGSFFGPFLWPHRAAFGPHVAQEEPQRTLDRTEVEAH